MAPRFPEERPYQQAQWRSSFSDFTPNFSPPPSPESIVPNYPSAAVDMELDKLHYLQRKQRTIRQQLHRLAANNSHVPTKTTGEYFKFPKPSTAQEVLEEPKAKAEKSHKMGQSSDLCMSLNSNPLKRD